MTEKPALRALQIKTVQNGFIASASRRHFEDGFAPDSYVFTTIAELSAWMVKQSWQIGESEGAS